jgi:tetratricopeptide (TPR) repeat protein
MSMLNDKDYWITQHAQAEKRAEADRYRLADGTRNSPAKNGVAEPLILRHKWVIRVALIALVIATVLVMAQQAFAQGPDKMRPWDGGNDPGGKPIAAYREGRYYLNHGDYDMAIAKLTEAIEGLPEEVFQIPGYADMYWFLGEAQEGAGLYAEALVSYQHFLDLVGEWAAPWTIEKVEDLAVQVNAMLLVDMQA